VSTEIGIDIRVPKEEAEQVVAIYKEIRKTVHAHYYAQEDVGAGS